MTSTMTSTATLDQSSSSRSLPQGMAMRISGEVDALEGYPLHVSIPATAEVAGTFSSKTVYVVVVDDCGKVREVARRFRAFVEFHSKLQRRGVLPQSIELPPKKWVNTRDPDFVEERRVGLERYLKQVMRQRGVLCDDSLWDFLEAEAATVVLPRLLVDHFSTAAANERLVLVQKICSQDKHQFRLCNRAVIRLLLELGTQEDVELQTRVVMVLKTLVGKPSARQLLLAAGGLTVVLQMVERCVEVVPGTAEARAGASVSEARRGSLRDEALEVLRLVVEREPGCMAGFFRQEQGLVRLRKLVEDPNRQELHAFVGGLLWRALESEGEDLETIMMALVDRAAAGLHVINTLLLSASASAKVLSALVLCDLCRAGKCEKALAAKVQGSLTDIPVEISAWAAAATQTLSVEGPLVGGGSLDARLLHQLCQGPELARLTALIPVPHVASGDQPLPDAVSAFVIWVLDCFVKRAVAEEWGSEDLECLKAHGLPEVLADLLWCGDAVVQDRAAFVLLQIGWLVEPELQTGGEVAVALDASILRARLRVVEVLRCRCQDLFVVVEDALHADEDEMRYKEELVNPRAELLPSGEAMIRPTVTAIEILAEGRSGLSAALQDCKMAVASLQEQLGGHSMASGTLKISEEGVMADVTRSTSADEDLATKTGSMREAEEVLGFAQERLEELERDLQRAEASSAEAEQELGQVSREAKDAQHRRDEHAALLGAVPQRIQELQQQIRDQEKRRGAVQASLRDAAAAVKAKTEQLNKAHATHHDADHACRTLATLDSRVTNLSFGVSPGVAPSAEQQREIQAVARDLPAKPQLQSAHAAEDDRAAAEFRREPSVPALGRLVSARARVCAEWRTMCSPDHLTRELAELNRQQASVVREQDDVDAALDASKQSLAEVTDTDALASRQHTLQRAAAEATAAADEAQLKATAAAGRRRESGERLLGARDEVATAVRTLQGRRAAFVEAATRTNNDRTAIGHQILELEGRVGELLRKTQQALDFRTTLTDKLSTVATSMLTERDRRRGCASCVGSLIQSLQDLQAQLLAIDDSPLEAFVEHS
mmetsp:Transcript_76521/g.175400  ORF Transcript_76521/g.175400 Transcript_76521/m.175400 type:complete len:1063 (-) Transcript_76521:122-3310(-)